MPTSSDGLNQGGPGDQAGPSTDPRDTGSSGSRQGRPQAQPTRPGPGRGGDADEATSPPKHEGGSGESPTGGDPRTPNIPGT